MTTPNELGWLAAGETVAYVHGESRHRTVGDAEVVRIGKRDIVVTVGARTEKFRITDTEKRGDNTWIHRRGAGRWGSATYLAPHDDPVVIGYRSQQKLDAALRRAHGLAGDFQASRNLESAEKLLAALTEYVGLQQAQQQR